MIEPELMPAGQYLLRMFLEISAARQSGMNGPMAISFTELKAYADLTDETLEPWEVDAIRLCDRAFLDEVSQSQNKE